MSSQKPPRFAEGTVVEVSSSQEQIKRLVQQHGATGFLLAEGQDDNGRLAAMLQFRIQGRMLKYERAFPKAEEAPAGIRKPFSENERQRLHKWLQGEWRRRWRALHLIIKAKLELVASGDVSFDREFLADIMLPDGSTVGAQAIGAVQVAYETGQMPRLLPGNHP